MQETAAAGRTVLFSTHLLEQAEKLCDRVAVVRQGQLAAEGTLADLRSGSAPTQVWKLSSSV